MRYLIAFLLFIVAAPVSAQVYLAHGELAVERPEPTEGSGTYGFGQSVLRMDDTLVIGTTGTRSSPDHPGVVMFHERVAGNWVEQQRLAGPAGEFDPQFFGYSLARIGDDLFVGAPHTEVDGEAFAGVVYRVTRDAGSGEWSIIETIGPPTPAENGLFGHALSVVGGTLFVGSPHADANFVWLGNGALGGRVYAYELDGGSGGWALVSTLQGDTDLPGDAFGTALAADAVRLVVGAPGEGPAGEGAIYAFDVADLDAAPVRFADDSGVAGLIRFGRALSLAGNRLLVGAEGDGAGNTIPQGAAHLVELGAGGPARITTFEVDRRSWFGWSVLLLDEQQALVGAPVAGTVYHFVEGADGWSLKQRVTEPVQTLFTGYFGEVLVLTEGELYIGAPSSMEFLESCCTLPPPPSQSGKVFEVPLVAPPLADLGLTVSAPAQAVAGSEADIDIRVTGDPDQDVLAAYVLVRLYMDIIAVPEDCLEIREFIFSCELGVIEAGGQGEARITIAVPGENSRTNTAYHVYAGSELADPDTMDNATSNFVDVLAPPPPPASSGGGSFGWFAALFLLAMRKLRPRIPILCDT